MKTVSEYIFVFHVPALPTVLQLSWLPHIPYSCIGIPGEEYCFMEPAVGALSMYNNLRYVGRLV